MREVFVGSHRLPQSENNIRTPGNDGKTVTRFTMSALNRTHVRQNDVVEDNMVWDSRALRSGW